MFVIRVITSHDECTSGTSRVLTVASLQRLNMEAPADYEVRSVIKFLNAQRITPIEIHRQLWQVYGPNVMSKQMVRRWCDNLQQVDNMCMMRNAVGGHPSLRTTLWSLCGNVYGEWSPTPQEIPVRSASDFPE